MELATLYAKASLVVIPSKYEAFSYAALEALSYGTPVLLSERVRIADYLDGVKGFQIFHYGDHTDFLNKIALSLGMVVETDKIKKIFDPEMIKEHYRSIYLNL
jgi:glycosyltransferase involved in cell wall biosynthesis